MTTYDRMNRTLGFIEDHLMDDLPLSLLARETGMSLFHFQRTFQALLGCSCMKYIRERRLTRAVQDLSDGQRILDIALACQFESQEAFTRAFKSQFGITPGQARSQGINTACLRHSMRLDPDLILKGKSTMKPDIRHLESLTVVGVCAAFIPEKTNDIVIPKLWDHFQAFVPTIAYRMDRAGIGVINCLPCFEVSGEKAELVYLAGVRVQKSTDVPHGLWATSIPAATYAIFKTSVRGDEINKTIDDIYGKWLPQSGYTRADGPELELYPEGFNADHSPEFEYAIPVLKVA